VALEVRAETKRLSIKAKVLLSLGTMLAVGLVVMTVLAVQRKRVERRKTLKTVRWLNQLADEIRRLGYSDSRIQGPSFIGRISDHPLGGISLYTADPNGSPEPFELIHDAWGRPLRFQKPGPVHKGWDLWSVGPDGIDEHGAGDDLLVGDNVWPETSSR
jgi:hypothetical protein